MCQNNARLVRPAAFDKSAQRRSQSVTASDRRRSEDQGAGLKPRLTACYSHSTVAGGLLVTS